VETQRHEQDCRTTGDAAALAFARQGAVASALRNQGGVCGGRAPGSIGSSGRTGVTV
jgi:hypothetical protein